MKSLQQLCTASFFETVLQIYDQQDLELRDTLVKLPTHFLEYFHHNVFLLMNCREMFRVFDISFVISEVLHQRMYKRDMADQQMVDIIKTCSYLTSNEVQAMFSELSIEQIEDCKNAYRTHCWCTILNQILETRN